MGVWATGTGNGGGNNITVWHRIRDEARMLGEMRVKDKDKYEGWTTVWKRDGRGKGGDCLGLTVGGWGREERNGKWRVGFWVGFRSWSGFRV